MDPSTGPDLVQPPRRLKCKIHKPLPRRLILPQLDPGLAKDPRGRAVDAVPRGVDDLADADLGDLHAARQTGAGVAVQHAGVAAVAASLEEGVLLGV